MLTFLLANLDLVAPSLGLLLMSALFSCAETALFSLTRHDLHQLERSANRREAAAAALRRDSSSLLIIILFVNMFCTVLIFVLSTVLLQRAAEQIGDLAAALAVIPVVAVAYVAEIFPKMLGRSFNRELAGPLAAPLTVLVRVLHPLARGVRRLVIQPAARLFIRPGASGLGAEELREFLEMSRQQGAIDPGESQLIGQVLRLRQLRVRQVMTPRVKMIGFDLQRPAGELKALFQSTGLGKIPVYERHIDNLQGMIDARKFFLSSPAAPPPWRELLEPAVFVPELQTVDRLLDRFQTTRTATAIVVDEYGGVAGLVALHDVVEQLIGEIQEPGDRPTPLLEPVGPDEWLAAGDVSLLDCAELLRQHLGATTAATVGGLVYAKLGRIPKPGDGVRIGHLQLTVEAMRGPRVERVRIRLADPAGAGFDAALEIPFWSSGCATRETPACGDDPP
jgi:CBS domain containing-hemolysin-like protein